MTKIKWPLPYCTVILHFFAIQLILCFPARSECRRVSFSNHLPLVTSGVWDEEGDVILLADTISQYVLEVGTNGSILAGKRDFELLSGGDALIAEMPWFLHRGPAGDFHLEDERGRIIKLDTQLFAKEKAQPIRVTAQSDLGPARLIAIYGWRPMRNGYLAFGDIEFKDIKGPGRYKSAFLQFNSTGILQIFDRPMDTLNEVRNHYLRNMPYIATLDGNVGYILEMEEVPSIRKVQLGIEKSQRLGSFPEDFRACPRLTRDPRLTRALRGAEQATYFYQKIESSKMAAGLYAWKHSLFLVAKEAMAKDKKTAWWLIELDPLTGAQISQARLPTNAAHITLVTGDTFAIIEKNPVEGIGEMHAPYMQTASMVLVPVSSLTGPQSEKPLDCGLLSD